MKEHGSESSSEMAKGKNLKSLKSLLKKPGQTKPRGQKNRVVINEKLNEFFAADYIILIKEECCADYEEECDCCCQEHEMIRLGNCKECRAELNLQFAGGGGVGRPVDADNVGGHEQVFRSGEGITLQQGSSIEEVDGRGSIEGVAVTPPRTQHHPHPQQQHETLSPPEGYKDVCDEGDAEEVDPDHHPVCAECDYYQQHRTEPEEQPKINGVDTETKSVGPDDEKVMDDDAVQDTCSDQAQQTTPDIHQRYLVETITMTTVTERRIVREVGEEDGTNTTTTITNSGGDEADSGAKRLSGILKNNKLTNSPHSSSESRDDGSVRFDELQVAKQPPAHGDVEIPGGDKLTHKVVEAPDTGDKETPETAELSLTFKLGNVSLVSNSLKPNSAVRQLFPDPRFISPPPVASNKTVATLATDQPRDEDDAEAQKFLITTESLRLFDAVKRSKLTGSQGENENEPTTIRKTIERNALRRSLICKYEPNSKKKNLRSKEFTLEERIRQLTCLDLDDHDTESSASENTTTGDSSDYLDFPVRTSPSGEEAKTESTARNVNATVSTTPPNHQDPSQASPSPQGTNQHQSTYKKITDLFAHNQKKIDTLAEAPTRNLPDLGIGNKFPAKMPVAKMNSDARKQFLASLAPLSCVAASGVDNREDYYQLSSAKVQGSGNGRDSVGYNSDSSYSLEDIEAALRGEERNYRNAGPPDVTRGTPTSTAGDDDSATDELLAFVEQDKTRTERIKKRYNDAEEHHEPEDDDDELNDYGFNRRPSVRGIKPKFGSTNEILRQLQSRSVAPNTLVDSGKPGSHLSWPSYHDNENEKRERLFAEDDDETYQTISDSRESNTINRINTMQRQIDDIYQTIAETAASVQGTLNRGSYLETTLPRTRGNNADPAHRYSGEHQHQVGAARMLRIAGGGEPTQTTIYNTLPVQSRRHPAYQCNANDVLPTPPTTGDPKCYRTMYLLPYNGISDPTYQNIQRILPPHASANYANHVERYPYPRNTRKEQPPRFYPNPTASRLYSQSALHLHLQQPLHDEMRVPLHHGVHALHVQNSQYAVQTVAYPAAPPLRGAGPGGGYAYRLHLGRGAADVQTQTISALPPSSNASSPLCNVLLSSPTKVMQQQKQRALCNVAERGVPEGAASAPSHDFLQQTNNVNPAQAPSPLLGHPGNGPPPNTQNSVYYAMNV